MKKVVIILFLFYAKTVAAQELYLGGNLGFSVYTFPQIPEFNALTDFNLGLTTQYTFGKHSPFGYEGNLICDVFGPNQGFYTGGIRPALGFTAINYVFFNPLWWFKGISLQFKGGFFYSHYFTRYIEPRNDYGAAFALNLMFRVSENSYWGIELSALDGLAKYYVSEPGSENSFFFGPNYSGYSNIIYTTLSFKFIFKINKAHNK